MGRTALKVDPCAYLIIDSFADDRCLILGNRREREKKWDKQSLHFGGSCSTLRKPGQCETEISISNVSEELLDFLFKPSPQGQKG
jgi:hypothetical protein